jgi:uncharacterized membrane protein YkoI
MRGILLVCLLAMVLSPVARAADPAPTYHLPTDFRGEVDQEGARAAVRRGDAAPFTEILKKVRPHIRGEIVGQKLEQHLGVWVYEFRVIAPDGHMNYVHFHARSGEAFTVRPLP